MFQPRLGTTLPASAEAVTPERIAAIGRSRIVTLELHPQTFDDDRDGRVRQLLKGMLRATDTRVATVHAQFGGHYDISQSDAAARTNAVEHTLAAVDLAVEFDAFAVVVHASGEPIEPAQRVDRMACTAEALEHVAARCRETGRRIALELLPRSCLGNTAEELLALVDRVGRDVVGVCLDVNHMMDRYRTLPDVVRTLGSRLITLHLSDYDGVDEKHWMPGKGVIDWRAFLEALREIDYGGPFNYECMLDGETAEQQIAALEANFDWLTGP